MSRLLLELQSCHLSPRIPLEISPDTPAEEGQEAQSKESSDEVKLVCPHKNCQGIYNRVDNLERHYTHHIACQAKCAVCDEDITSEGDRKRHIHKCLTNCKHESLPEANKAWHKALRDAKMTIGSVYKKRSRGGNASRRRKVPKSHESQKRVTTEERSRAVAPNNPAPGSSTSPHVMPIGMPIRAELSLNDTIEGSFDFTDWENCNFAPNWQEFFPTEPMDAAGI